MLQTLAGLENLTGVGYISIQGNSALYDLRALSNAALTGKYDSEHPARVIRSNPRLFECEVDWAAGHFNQRISESGKNGPPGMCAP